MFNYRPGSIIADLTLFFDNQVDFNTVDTPGGISQTPKEYTVQSILDSGLTTAYTDYVVDSTVVNAVGKCKTLLTSVWC